MRKFEVVKDEFRKYPDVEIKLPTRATKKSAGYDLYSPIDVIIKYNEHFIIWTDVKVLMNENDVFNIVPRSSTAIKQNLIIKNIVGVVDSDYYSNKSNDGNIGACIINTGIADQTIKKGDKICQGIFSNYLITDDDAPVLENRIGGIGSTGEK